MKDLRTPAERRDTDEVPDAPHPSNPTVETVFEPREATTERGATTEPKVDSLLVEIRKAARERLEIESRVAQGGMGAIDSAMDRALERRIALKTLHPHLREDDAAVRLFLREARLTGLLEHPHIVPVYDIAETDEGQLYFAMKLIEGRTFSDVIRALPRGPLETTTLYELLEIVAKVCDALAFAHSRGVLHCDIKAENVMVGDFGQVYLTDWGIARLANPDSAEPDGAIMGTPCYMSPEQAWGDRRKLDVRSDVFLLGALLYEVLTRRPPYVAADRLGVLELAHACEFPAPGDVAEEGAIPLELERIVLRAMSKMPEARYPTVSAFKDDLVRFLRGGAEFPRRAFGAGEAIVREGEPGEAAYIIISGRCEVRRRRLGDAVQVVSSLAAGEVFGEMAILSSGPRTATVVATEPTTVLVVTRAALDQEMAALKPWVAKLLKSVAEKFRDVDARNRALEPHA